MTPVFEFLRQRIGAITLGVALAGILLIMIGPGAVWVLLTLILAAAVIVRFIVPEARARLPATQANPGDEGLAILSPLVRKVLGQMPVPVMLLDSGARVLFVNEPMRDRGGTVRRQKAHQHGPAQSGSADRHCPDQRRWRTGAGPVHRARCRSSGITKPIRRG